MGGDLLPRLSAFLNPELKRHILVQRNLGHILFFNFLFRYLLLNILYSDIFRYISVKLFIFFWH